MKMWTSNNFMSPSITNTIQTNSQNTSSTPTNSTDQTMQITHNNINYHLHFSIIEQLLSSGDGGDGGGDGGYGSSINQPDGFQISPNEDAFLEGFDFDDDAEEKGDAEDNQKGDAEDNQKGDAEDNQKGDEDEEEEEVEVVLIQTDEHNVTIIPLSEFESEDAKKAEENMQAKMKNAKQIGLGTAIKTKGGKLLIKAADSIASNVKLVTQSALGAAQVAVPTLGNAALNLTTNVVIPVGVAVANNVVIPAIVHGVPIITSLVIHGVSWSLYNMLGRNVDDEEEEEVLETKPLTLRKRNVLNTLLRLKEARDFMGDDLYNSLEEMDPGHFRKDESMKPGMHRAESMYRAIHTLKDLESKSQGNTKTITKTVFNCDCLPKEEKFTYDCKCTDEVASLPQVIINEKPISASLMAWKRVRTFQPYNRRQHTHTELFKIISTKYNTLATNIKDIAEQLESTEMKDKLSKISKQIKQIERLRSHYKEDQNHILPPFDALVSSLTSEDNKQKNKVVFTELPKSEDIDFVNKTQQDRFQWKNLLLRPFDTVLDKHGDLWRPVKAEKDDDNIEFVMQQVRHAISDILDTRAIPRIEGLNQMLQDCVTQYLINERKEEKNKISGRVSGKVSGKEKPLPPSEYNAENRVNLFLKAREARARKKTGHN